MDERKKIFLQVLTEVLEDFDEKINDLNKFRDSQIRECDRLIEMNENLKAMNENLKARNKSLIQTVKSMENIREQNNQLIKDNESLITSLEAIKQENLRLKQENANLRQLEANWNKHIRDDTRHVKRINGATPHNLARASEANQQRGHETNIKIFRAIFGYLQNAQDKSKVDMSWLMRTTGLSESTIRQTVKELQEGKLNKHTQKQQDGFLLYGLPVPPAFISWEAKANFFNVPR